MSEKSRLTVDFTERSTEQLLKLSNELGISKKQTIVKALTLLSIIVDNKEEWSIKLTHKNKNLEREILFL